MADISWEMNLGVIRIENENCKDKASNFIYFIYLWKLLIFGILIVFLINFFFENLLVFEVLKFRKFVNFLDEGWNFEQYNFRMADISGLKI